MRGSDGKARLNGLAGQPGRHGLSVIGTASAVILAAAPLLPAFLPRRAMIDLPFGVARKGDGVHFLHTSAAGNGKRMHDSARLFF
jgi:hypothetical protein